MCKQKISYNRGFIMKSLFKSVLTLTFFSFLTRALGFVIKIMFSRSLTPETIGIYSIVMSIFMVMVTLVTSGLPLIISRNVASSNDNQKNYSAVWTGTSIGLVMSIIVCFFMIVAKPIIADLLELESSYEMILYTLPAVVFTGLYAGIHGYFWGKERYATMSIIELFEQLVRIITCVVFFYIINSVSARYVPAISLSISCVFSTILAFIIYFVEKNKFIYSKDQYKNIIKATAPITAVRVSSSLLQPIISILLPARLTACGFSTTQSLSLLGILSGMTMPLLSIPSAIIGSLSMALIPRVSSMFTSKNHSALSSQIQKAVDFTLCCSFLVIPIFIALGVPICKILFDNETAGHYLVSASILLIPQGICMLSNSLLNSMEGENSSFFNSILGSILLIACIYFLPKYFDIHSMIYGMIVNFSVVALLNYRKIIKLIGRKIHFAKTILYCSIITVMIVFLTKFLYPIFSIIFGSFMSVVLCCIIDVVIYAILLAVFGIIDIEYIKNKVSNKKTKAVK